RHIFYGLSLLDKYKNAGKKKLYMIYALCDETFSVNVTLNDIEGVDKEDVYFAVTLLNQSYWVLGTYLGALFGGIISINTQGLDFVMTALFIVIFLDYLLKNKDYLSSASGFIVSLLSLIMFGKDNFIIPAMIAIVVVLLSFRRKYDAN
ncbi:MAG: AzlC family ABC transporter permease, partial [Spirochaetales bacterium]|nr:AzlC family ABC transporter permease [Spirochaetales bacterium]